jgi:hypothetical protein
MPQLVMIIDYTTKQSLLRKLQGRCNHAIVKQNTQGELKPEPNNQHACDQQWSICDQ